MTEMINVYEIYSKKFKVASLKFDFIVLVNEKIHNIN